MTSGKPTEIETILEAMVSNHRFPHVLSGHFCECLCSDIDDYSGDNPKTLFLFCDFHDDNQGYPQFDAFFHGVADPELILTRILETQREILSIQRKAGVTQPTSLVLEFNAQKTNELVSVNIEYCTSGCSIDSATFPNYGEHG